MSDMNLLLLNIPRARRMHLSRMNQWEELHITLPRAPLFSHLPTEDLERALIRQRWACGFLGWLAGFQSEVWGTGPVGRDRKGKRLPGGRIDFLALAWWWFEVITDQLMQNALPETPNRYTRTWKRYWWTGWRALARGFLQVSKPAWPRGLWETVADSVVSCAAPNSRPWLWSKSANKIGLTAPVKFSRIVWRTKLRYPISNTG